MVRTPPSSSPSSCPGGDLAAALARAGAAPLSVDRAVHLGLQLCEALAAAYQRGVVHLDVKPSNVLLDGCDGLCAHNLARHLWVTAFSLSRVPRVRAQRAY